MAKIRAAPWPVKTRIHYIRFFRLQERLRVHLKLAQELATTKRLISYRKQLVEPDGVLRNIYDFLERMHQALGEIAKVRNLSGRPPKWFQVTMELATLTEVISKTMPLIEQDLNQLLDVAVIKKTTRALNAANQIREKQLSLPLDQAEIGLDEHGLETIIDLSPVTHILDFNSWQLHTIKSIK